MRCWEVTAVKAECPHCGSENKINVSELTDDEVWMLAGPWEHECEWCRKYFWIEVDDDDR
ncbi:MAG: hypothetical protein IKN60_04585 [Bacteroidales bacterium]|nr:hypothetical protein [Bacteroidales bacterium]